ncbi:MAG: leucyl aminopeptidase family protein [Legionellaceae bacterium]|nr:leucyl aminopeptidase family protein [Legionellaceae bacterium]
MKTLVNLFYRSDEKDAIPLQLLATTDIEQTRHALPAGHRQWLSRLDFKGILGQVALCHDRDGNLQAAYIGAGSAQWEQAMAQAALLLPAGAYRLEQPLSSTACLFWGMAQYRYDRYKTAEVAPRVLCVSAQARIALERDLQAVFRARDLINAPANDMGPGDLAAVLQQVALDYQAELQQWEGPQLLEANFPAIHAVGRASIQAPRLLQLRWGNPAHPVVALVGKGVCFDSGGLDLKPSSAMRLMKKDMGGAANAIALAEWLMAARLPIRLHLYVAAVENAIGPDAFRPGDVIRMRNGLSVEVDNTDAEGRLVLADAMVKAVEDQAELLIDFATLTGAARVAVGTDIAAMFCNDEQLAGELAQAALQVNDPLWRLPLHQDYNALLESTVADLLNSAPSSYAGAITAALFLQRFVPPSLRWVHFDIMAWNISARPGKPIGGEAMAIRAVAHWLSEQYR